MFDNQIQRFFLQENKETTKLKGQPCAYRVTVVHVVLIGLKIVPRGFVNGIIIGSYIQLAVTNG